MYIWGEHRNAYTFNSSWERHRQRTGCIMAQWMSVCVCMSKALGSISSLPNKSILHLTVMQDDLVVVRLAQSNIKVTLQVSWHCSGHVSGGRWWNFRWQHSLVMWPWVHYLASTSVHAFEEQGLKVWALPGSKMWGLQPLEKPWRVYPTKYYYLGYFEQLILGCKENLFFHTCLYLV